jgi:hypothetical protein
MRKVVAREGPNESLSYAWGVPSLQGFRYLFPPGRLTVPALNV